MKVILKQDVKNLGKKDNMVEVNDGYARNFLIPKGLAEEANAVNMNTMKQKMEADKTRKDRELVQAKALAEKIKDITLTIKTKSGENGKLFGSITSKDISDRLKQDFKLDIDKKRINLSDALKSLGTTEVEVKLYPQVSAKLSVKIVQEQ